MTHKKQLTQSDLKYLLHYNKLTGLFTRNVSRNFKHRVGDVAGTIHRKGYINIRLSGITYQAHRLAFLWVLGSIPIQVDHKNQIRSDNRWTNLRNANSQLNSKNRSLAKNNTSGCVGVNYLKTNSCWAARIGNSGKRVFLGNFKKLEDAIFARKNAEIELNYYKNHGRKGISYNG